MLAASVPRTSPSSAPHSNRIQLAVIVWAVLFGILAISTIILFLAIHGFVKNAPYQDPLLSTPSAFTLLAIVVALSAYLRSVAGAADDKRHKIRAHEEPLYPITEEHTTKKLIALDETYDRLQIGARFLIWLTILVTLRLFLENIARFGFYFSSHATYFRVIDFWIFEWLTLALIVLSVMHYKAQRRDESIRRDMLEWLSKNEVNASHG